MPDAAKPSKIAYVLLKVIDLEYCYWICIGIQTSKIGLIPNESVPMLHDIHLQLHHAILYFCVYGVGICWFL
jgi:hypothetical protein